MPIVYVKPSNPYRRRFHKSETCTQLTKGPANGEAREVHEIDLVDLEGASPCLRCYPDAPRAKSAHRYCYICDTGKIRPCEHNGGVLVYMTWTHRKGSLYRDPGDVFIQERYVWPEYASRYVLA
jgi:hypothetical protein